MGTPIVIDPQPGDLVPQSELDATELLARQVTEATKLAGPMPQPPTYLVERGYPQTHVDPTTGWIVQDGPDPGYEGDPNAQAMASAYGSDIQMWNDRFKAILAVLQGKPVQGN